MKALRVPLVLPRLVLQTALGAPLVLDEAVAVAVAVLLDPIERGERGLLQVAHERRVVRPTPHLREQDEVERCRVDGAVVALVPCARRLAVAHLVHDLAGLRVARGIVFLRLEIGEDFECGTCSLGPEQQRLQARDDRVAAEDRHEPRNAGTRQPPDRAVVRAHAQGREVGDRLAERVPERVPRSAQLRHAQLPCGQRVAHAADLLAESEPREARRDELAVRQRDPLTVKPPALARRQREELHHPRAVDLAALGEDHLRLQRQLAVVRDHELVAALVVLDRAAIGQRFRTERVTEGEVEVLDGEDVREVGADVELHVELDGLHALVLEHERVLHPVADEALAPDREHVRSEPGRQWVAHEERRGEVLDLVGRQQQRTLAVDRQLQRREEARVLGEQALHVAVQVAELVADAEGRAFEDAELLVHQLSVRSMRPPDDCASALTTSSSTLTRAGRVTTQTTHSAMSSGCMASTPSYTLRAVSSSPRKRTSEKSVCTSPGSTVQMWIGRPSRSSRSAYVNPRTANFDVT